MLKPIKNFLTYLQRNANSSNIFGLTTVMGPTEQPRLDETIMMSNEDSDPLYDPLALDDNCPDGVAVEGTNGVSTGSEAAGQPDEEDADEEATGKIILVDVTSLKSGMRENELETDDDDDDDDEVEEEVVVSDEEILDISSNETPIPDQEIVDISFTETPIPDHAGGTTASEGGGEAESRQLVDDQSSDCIMLSAECDDVIDVESDGTQGLLDSSLEADNDCFETPAPVVAAASVEAPEENLQAAAEQQQEIPLTNGHHDVAVASLSSSSDQPQRSDTCVVSATATPEQIQGVTSVVEEEEASDGSDSGLGLEPSRNGDTTSTTSDEIPPIKSSLKRRSEPPRPDLRASALEEKDMGVSSQKRVKKGISFEGVTVFYFPRIQGFGCVPSQGGCTLGMEFQHVHSRRLTLAEHSSEQRKVHRQQLQELNPRSSSSDDSSSEEEPSESGSEAESESYAFLQPVTTRQRRALLKAAGVRKIDSTEKDECREIRTSREVCGCTCRGYCDPATCACSLAGIKCQVDRPSFPCGCTQDGCANKAGRVEFNPARVRSHFIHTIMRLNLDGKASEVRRTVVANGGGGAISGAGGSSATATTGGVTAESSYMVGGEKNWSNGPIRLPPGMIYGAGMHSAPSPGPSGIATDGLVSMNQHSLSAPPYHPQQHQPSLPMPNGLHHHFSHPSHLQQSDGSYMPASAYHNYLVASDAQLYLTPSPSTTATTTPQHLTGGLIPPAHLPESLDMAYSYHRDYFDGISDAAPDAQIYYNYEASTTGVAASGRSTTNGGSLDPAARRANNSQHLPVPTPMSMQQVPEAGSISPFQHTVPTDHDRHPQDHPNRGSDSRVGRSLTSSATVEGDPKATDTSLDTPDGSSYACSEAPFSTNEPFSLSAKPTESNPKSRTVRNASSEACDDISLEIAMDVSETAAPKEASPPVAFAVVEGGSTEKSSATTDHSAAENSRPDKKQADDAAPSAEMSCFIDLTAYPVANPARLEAINDMLACSRRTAILARRSIAAEDDDELRDFQHSPVHRIREEQPPAPVTVILDEDADVGDCTVVERVLPERTDSVSADVVKTILPVNGSQEKDIGHQNGTSLSEAHKFGKDDQRLGAVETANTKGKKGSEKPPSVGLRLPNRLGKSEVPATPSPEVALVNPATGSLEPSENLCEIIKNSIVETAVSH